MKTYTVWRTKVNTVALVEGSDPPKDSDNRPEPGAKQIGRFEATDWHDASRKHHDTLHSGGYERPDHDEDSE